MTAAFCPRGISPECPVLPRLRDHLDGTCDHCGRALVGRQKRWCSSKCASFCYKEFAKHHDWNDARKAALLRDGYKCVKCGVSERELTRRAKEHGGGRLTDGLMRLYQLEVNHIEPRRGQGYKRGCHHHLSNLETLCHACHLRVTALQRTAPLEPGGKTT